MRKAILSALYLIPCLLFSQGFERPVPYDITSDYGPRNLNEYDWHPAIDYGSPMWTPIEAVEGGNIRLIAYEEGRAGWYIRIQGDSAYWTYMHLFGNENPSLSPDNRYEARSVYLVDPNTGQISPHYVVYVFIFWLDRQNSIAEKVLAFYDYRGRWIRWGDGYILDQNGERILTQGSVANREVVGPSGQSGSAVGHPHLDIRASSQPAGAPYDINPLYYIIHPQPNYTLTIHHPPADAVLYHRLNAPESLQLNERIRVNINST